MQLPNAANAYIEEVKLLRYILNLNHEDGGDKARAYLRYGYSVNRPKDIADDVLALARRGDAIFAGQTEYGTKYVK
jgi:hypothetical protein